MKDQDRPNKKERERDECRRPGANTITQEAEADHCDRPYGPRQTHDDSRADTLVVWHDLLRHYDDRRHKRQVEKSCDGGRQ